MGEPIVVIQKQSNRPGYVRFETNRTFTGMGHERYISDDAIYGERPPDELARSLFASDKVDEVHIYAQTVTVKLVDGASSVGLRSIIADHYIYYRPDVEVPTAESFS